MIVHIIMMGLWEDTTPVVLFGWILDERFMLRKILMILLFIFFITIVIMFSFRFWSLKLVINWKYIFFSPVLNGNRVEYYTMS